MKSINEKCKCQMSKICFGIFTKDVTLQKEYLKIYGCDGKKIENNLVCLGPKEIPKSQKKSQKKFVQCRVYSIFGQKYHAYLQKLNVKPLQNKGRSLRPI